MTSSKLRIAIIGAGPAGLCMGKRLLDEGYEDFVILEREHDVGGTWLTNCYPGSECDIFGFLYSFSFDPKADWLKIFPSQTEILDYLRNIAEKYGIRSHCRFNNAVKRAEWNDSNSSWVITLDSGERVSAEVVISAIGIFNVPRWPEIEGLDKFKGSLWHSSAWDSNHNLSKDRVAVIGSAASAVGMLPEIVKTAPAVYLFQRTPNWVLPKDYNSVSEEQLNAILSNPSYLKTARNIVESNIHEQDIFSDLDRMAQYEVDGLAALSKVKDPNIRQKLRPMHPIGTRIPHLSNDYYQAFNQPNLELVTEQINRVNQYSILTEDGVERQIDTIVLATGFKVNKLLSAIEVFGSKGQDINEAWSDGAIAYLGIMTSGFPNLFMLFGPNTNGGSIPSMIEAQVDYILDHLRKLINNNIISVDVKPDRMHQYDNHVQSVTRANFAERNGYKNHRSATLRSVTYCPFPIAEYRRLTTRVDSSAFKIKKGRI